MTLQYWLQGNLEGACCGKGFCLVNMIKPETGKTDDAMPSYRMMA